MLQDEQYLNLPTKTFKRHWMGQRVKRHTKNEHLTQNNEIPTNKYYNTLVIDVDLVKRNLEMKMILKIEH